MLSLLTSIDWLVVIDVATKVVAGASMMALAVAKLYPKAGKLAGWLEKAHVWLGKLGLNSQLKK
jgi:hypothetical protein